MSYLDLITILTLLVTLMPIHLYFDLTKTYILVKSHRIFQVFDEILLNLIKNYLNLNFL
jgi:hypothetical protein